MKRVQMVETIIGVLLLEFFFILGYGRIKMFCGKVFQFAINFDVLYFVFIILSSMVLTIIFIIISKKLLIAGVRGEKENSRREFLNEVVTYFVIAYTHIRVFFNTMAVENATSNYMPWHMTRFYEWIVIALTGICMYECRKIIKLGLSEQQRIPLRPWYFLMAAIAVYSLYQPNCFISSNDAYHVDAYFNSVYRVLHLQPYNEINTGVYGFYGIILAPITKLMGGDFEDCLFALIILTYVSILCYFYVLEKITDGVILRILASICIITTFVAGGSNIYLQLWPHRIIFLGYILAFIVWKNKYDDCFKYIVIGYIIMVFSVVWNFETGIGCVLAYFGSDVVKTLQKHSVKDFMGWKRVIGDIIQIPIVVICAWIFVGCYNLLVSHNFVSLRVFLFPFIGNPYIGNLNISLSVFPSAWMQVLFMIVSSIVVVILSTNLCGKRYENQKLVYLSACTIGVSVQMLYFVNRSVYGNLYIVLPIAALIMVYWIECFKCKEIWDSDKLCNGCLRAVCTLLVSVMIMVDLMAVCRYFPIQSAKQSYRNMEGVEQLKMMVSEQIPKNTFGIGIGVPEIYSYLGWNTGFYGIDIADFTVLPEKTRATVIEIVTNEENVFSNKWSLNEVFGYDMNAEFYKTHDLEAEIKYGEIEYVYYCKNSSYEDNVK